jgi:hypothetical protein
MSPQQDPLDPLLERWGRLAPEQPESVGREVWRRIADADAETSAPRATTWWWSIEAAFRRPAFAAAFIVACTVFGLFLAEFRLSRLHADRSARLQDSYLQLINPASAGQTAPQVLPAAHRP